MIQLEHNQRAMALLREFARNGRLPHAILVEAPAGCGKKTFARLLAQTALCAGTDRPCNACPHCGKVEKGIHPDICYYTTPEDKLWFPVELVREIRQEAYIAPNEGVCKVYLIDQAHTMNAMAQNALLKLIEEPPEFVRFILLCENRSQMLPTILSRVTSIELEQPTVEQCGETLARLAPEATEDCRKAAALGAGGNIGRALSLLGAAKPSKAAADARALRQALIEEDRYRCLRLLAGYDKDREGLQQMLALLLEGFARLSAAGYRPDAPEEDRRVLGRVLPHQAVAAAQAVDGAVLRARRNVGIPLLCACMIEDVKAALDQ